MQIVHAAQILIATEVLIPASYRDDHDLPSSCHLPSSSCHHHDASSSSCHHHVSSCHHHDASSSSCHHHGRHDRGPCRHDLLCNNRTSSRRGVSCQSQLCSGDPCHRDSSCRRGHQLK